MNKKLIVTAISLSIAAGIIVKLTSEADKTIDSSQVSTNNQSIIKTQQTLNLSASQTKQRQSNEPTTEQLRAKAVITQAEPELSLEVSKAREKLKNELHELLHCHETNTCPVDNSDPRAADLLLGQQITAKIEEYTELTLQHDFFDEETAQLIQEFISNQDGYVQESAINLMSAMAPNSESAQALLATLTTSYDAKIMRQSMKELQRYPELSNQVDKLYQQSLQTGSFYVAQEIALNILPQLNTSNIDQYEAVAKSLPQNSKRSDALWSNINEYKLRQSGG